MYQILLLISTDDLGSFRWYRCATPMISVQIHRWCQSAHLL